jgi:hypothetical protein
MLICVGRRAIGRKGDGEESKTECFYMMISNCTCVKYRLKQGPIDIRYKKLSPIMLILYEQSKKDLIEIVATQNVVGILRRWSDVSLGYTFEPRQDKLRQCKIHASPWYRATESKASLS